MGLKNLPETPSGSGEDVWLSLVEHVVVPAARAFEPQLVLVSAGFDAHRDDPLTGLGLTAGDYAALVRRLIAAVPPGRTVTFLEGGYSLSALRDSVATTVPE